MKRINGLMEKILDPVNLRIAFLKAAKGKRDRPEVLDFAGQLGKTLSIMRNELEHEKFVFGKFSTFYVHDPKERLIYAPGFSERVLHHAIMNVCEPVFDRHLIFDTYACRKGKGRLAAIERAKNLSRSYLWFLKMDIHKYFDSIDHNILTGLLCRKFKDKGLLRLFGRVVGSYETKKGKGIPIGALTSQHFANLYLSPLDRFIKESLGCRAYVRYMDDMVIWGNKKNFLKSVLKAIKDFLNKNLALQFKPFPFINLCDNGLDFLGFRLFPTKVLLNRRSCKRLKRKWKKYSTLFDNGILSQRQFQDRVTALTAFTLHADTSGLREKIFWGGGQRQEPG
ncbi:MAG: reverse transcriptase domain-containing protein [bacterium]